MVRTIIEAYPKEKRVIGEKDSSKILHVAECFSNTIQGEGINVGQPATFLRLQFCTLNCKWCDTTEVWRQGNPYTIEELLDVFEKNNVVEDLRNGHHLVLTGGSPIKQQGMLIEFYNEIVKKHLFLPYIEIENECTLMPSRQMSLIVNCWNNSPKLSNSGMNKELRYKPAIIKLLSTLNNSWFKFVISKEEDWKEIEDDFLNSDLIKRKQIILMPEGQCQEELNKKREMVMELAVKENVRFTDRLHITIWNRKTGV